MSTVSVKKAARLNNGEFEAMVTAPGYDDKPTTYAVHTNIHGDGLWIDGKQVTGTSQFRVRTVAAWRAALRRWFKYD